MPRRSSPSDSSSSRHHEDDDRDDDHRDDDDRDHRLTEVEIKLTHHERLLEELNQVIIDQQAVITVLKSRMEHFQQVVTDLQEEPANEPPPHY